MLQSYQIDLMEFTIIVTVFTYHKMKIIIQQEPFRLYWHEIQNTTSSTYHGLFPNILKNIKIYNKNEIKEKMHTLITIPKSNQIFLETETESMPSNTL